jgi:integrase
MGDDRLREMVGQLLHEALATELRSSLPHAPSVTVSTYAEMWLAQRRQLQLVSVDDDATRLRLHALPVIGQLELAAVHPKTIRDLILHHRSEAKLSPRTIRHIYAALSNLFRCAVADELIPSSPCVLPRGVIPPCVDRDPDWRARAIFTRPELEALLFDRRIDEDRRMLHGLKGLAALRHSEAATLRWHQLEEREPLSAILLGKTKARKPRAVPIHPTLQWMVEHWRRVGFPQLMGHAPRPIDMVVPARRAKSPRLDTTAQHNFTKDLAALGLRHRRGHDLRRTMITLARADGARDEVLKAITHGPSTAIQEQYTSWPWPVLCAELVKLQVGLGSGTADQLELPLPLVATKSGAKKIC